MTALGTFLASVVVVMIGVFLMIASYSRRPILLKSASLGSLNIDPDSPGTRQRAIMFSIGVFLVLVGLILIVLEKLTELAVFAT